MCIHSGMIAIIAYVSPREVLIIVAKMIWSLTNFRIRDVFAHII